MTIRAKLLIVSLCLILAVVGMGAYGVYGVNRISELMTQTYDRAMMASIHAEQAHTSFIKVDRALRDALSSRTVDDFDRYVAAADSAAADVLSDLDVVAERTWSADSAALVTEIKGLVSDKQARRADILPGLRQQLAGGNALPVFRPVTPAPRATTPAAAATPSAPGKSQAPAEDSGVQIVKRKSAGGASSAPVPAPVAVPSRAVPDEPVAPAVVAGAAAPKADDSKAPRVAQVGEPAAAPTAAPAMPRVAQPSGTTSVAIEEAPVVARPAPIGAAALFQGSDEIETKLRALADRAAEAGYIFRESSRKISRTILAVTIGALVAAVGIIAAVLLLFGRWIAQPLRQVIHHLHDLVVGGGTLEQRLTAMQELPVQSADEIGQLRASFNATLGLLRKREAEVKRELRHEELQGNISKFLNVAHEIAQGDLTKRGMVTDDVIGSVVDAINVMVEQIATVIGDVRNAALRVAVSADEMITATGDTTAGAQSQAREAMAVKKTVEQLMLAVREVADSAQGSALAARQALDASRKGDQAVHESLAGMQRIRTEVQAMSKKIKTLGDRSMEISNIVNTIEGIAKETHLLALNASIEAAGAGEAGVRFTIVAEQVRKLAQRCAKATKDIGALIKNVQDETREAIVVMEQGTTEVESGYGLTVQAGDSLKEIAAVSQKSAELAQSISMATQQQVRGVDGVAAAVQSISSVAVQTEQGMLQTRKTVDELARLAEELRGKLAQFTIVAG
jgi:methyl-accepting chemotaxis protein